MFDQGNNGNQNEGSPVAVELHPLLAELEEISTQRRALDHREAQVLADQKTADACLAQHGHHLPTWLGSHTKVGKSAAQARIRIATRMMAWYPELETALGEGRIGWNHVAKFDRAANPRIREQLIELIGPLVDLAEVATFERWCQELAGIAERLDFDGGHDPSADPANNFLRLTPTTDGTFDVSGRLVGELAFTISKLIEAETDRQMARHRSDLEAAGVNLDGLVGNEQLPSRSQARAEALGELVLRGAGVPDGEGRSLSPDLVVVYDNTHPGGILSDADGNSLPNSMLDWLVSTGTVRSLEVSSSGDPLRLGITRRFASNDQRRALAVRDGGCVFAGCTDGPASCDAHHVILWDGHDPTLSGPTDVENMALLCRHHHRVTHQPNWRMERIENPHVPGEVRFRWLITPKEPGSQRRIVYSQRHHIS